MRTSLPPFVKILVICCFLALAASAFAAVGGALYTTNPSGVQVNGNIYTQKSDVYINGGPQNKNDSGLVPAPGYYYFQVTDPSGSVLLSKDAVTCRVVYVNLNSGGNGVIDGVPGNDGSDATAGGFGSSSCYHNMGPANAANGSTPVQLCNPNASLCPTDFADTPNPGGEYKAWITPVDQYVGPNGTCTTGANHFGFCDSQSKTDNFKIKAPGTATITACKFNDVDDDGLFDNSDLLLPGWPITATGVDGGTVTQTTDQDGCTSFTYTFPKGVTTPNTVTLTEGSMTGWTQTAPPNGTCTLTGTVNAQDTCTVSGATPSSGSPASGGFITLTVSPDDIVTAPYFGNTNTSTTPPPVQVSKTASGGNNFVWNISKSVDKTEIDDSTGNATFNYTVTVTHDSGSGWVVGGVVTFVNPASTDQSITSLADSTDVGGSCSVPDFVTGMTIPAGGTPVNLNYTCTFSTNPGPGTNTATADTLTPATAKFDFSSANTTATVTDSIAGNLGTVQINADNTTSCRPASAGFTGTNLACSTNGSTVTFTYSETFTDPAGTCTDHDNTASFTTNTNSTATDSNDIAVKQCVGKDLTVVKTATASFDSSVSKSVDKTSVEQSGGNITFNYSVTASESNWKVSGTITVTNPNDWEPITFSVSDLLSDSGGSCSVTGGSNVTLAAGASSGPLSYSCTFTSRPTAVIGTNTASASVTAGVVPDTTVSSLAVGYTFATLTITDNVQSSAYPSGCNATLGTVSVTTTTKSTTPGCGVINLASPSWGKFTYSITDANASPGTCNSYNNTAQITGGSSSNQVTVTVCNTNTGGLTMGFWQNKNGQGIISGGGSTGGVCNSGTFLRQLNPFQSLSATATCSQVASYVSGVIGAATCTSSTGTCNAMLKAQMLATALDVFFSSPGSGDPIKNFNGGITVSLGGVAIDLSKVCEGSDGGFGGSCPEDARQVFGICTGTNTPVSGCTSGVLGTTVLQMLFYSDFNSALNGTPVASPTTGATWYKQMKGLQVLAKDAFDSINNQKAPIAPTSGAGNPSF